MTIPHAAIAHPLEQASLPGWALLPVLLSILLAIRYGWDWYLRAQRLSTLARHELTVRGFMNKGTK